MASPQALKYYYWIIVLLFSLWLCMYVHMETVIVTWWAFTERWRTGLQTPIRRRSRGIRQRFHWWRWRSRWIEFWRSDWGTSRNPRITQQANMERNAFDMRTLPRYAGCFAPSPCFRMKFMMAQHNNRAIQTPMQHSTINTISRTHWILDVTERS